MRRAAARPDLQPSALGARSPEVGTAVSNPVVGSDLRGWHRLWTAGGPHQPLAPASDDGIQFHLAIPEEKFVGDPRRCVQRPIVRVTRHLESLIGTCLISALIMH